MTKSIINDMDSIREHLRRLNGGKLPGMMHDFERKEKAPEASLDDLDIEDLTVWQPPLASVIHFRRVIYNRNKHPNLKPGSAIGLGSIRRGDKVFVLLDSPIVGRLLDGAHYGCVLLASKKYDVFQSPVGSSNPARSIEPYPGNFVAIRSFCDDVELYTAVKP